MTRAQTNHISKKLEEMHKDLKELREKDIPNLKVEVAVIKAEASNSAKIIAGLGGAIAILTSTAIAYLR